jgi:hypothetical protein
MSKEFCHQPEIDIFVLVGHDLLKGCYSTERPQYTHMVNSGFCELFRKFFPSVQPVDYCRGLAAAGLIEFESVRAGVYYIKPLSNLVLELTAENRARSFWYKEQITKYLAQRESRIQTLTDTILNSCQKVRRVEGSVRRKIWLESYGF